MSDDTDALYVRLLQGGGRELIDARNIEGLRERARRDRHDVLQAELDAWQPPTPADAGPLESLGQAISAPVREAAAPEDPALGSGRG